MTVETRPSREQSEVGILANEAGIVIERVLRFGEEQLDEERVILVGSHESKSSSLLLRQIGTRVYDDWKDVILLSLQEKIRLILGSGSIPGTLLDIEYLGMPQVSAQLSKLEDGSWIFSDARRKDGRSTAPALNTDIEILLKGGLEFARKLGYDFNRRFRDRFSLRELFPEIPYPET